MDSKADDDRKGDHEDDDDVCDKGELYIKV